MKIVELRTSDGRSIASARMAHTFRARWIGLIRQSMLESKEGLLLVPGGSIHTLGMRFPIDAVFLDRQLRILKLLPHMVPWRFAFAPANTRLVLELRAGRIAEVGLAPGTNLCACFDDEENEESVPGVRSRVRDSTLHPRPSSPCIAFSLRLPLRARARTDRFDARSHIKPSAKETAPDGSSQWTEHSHR